MLGDESIVHGHDLGTGTRPTCEARSAARKASPITYAAVEVENDVARFDSVDRDLGRSDAAGAPLR
jgi:hypothetical protein